MLPFESGSGQIWHHDQHLCDAAYEIFYPLGFANLFHVHHLKFAAQNYEPGALLALPELILVTANGTQYHLPQSLKIVENGYLECTVNLKE